MQRTIRSRPSRPRLPLAALAAGLLLVLAAAALAQTGPTPVVPTSLALTLEPVVTGLDKPVYATHAGDGSGRLFTASLDGYSQMIIGGRVAEQPFLDLRERVTSLIGEQGFYSIAFHPDYRRRDRRLFVSYTERASGDLIVSEFRLGRGAETVPLGTEERVLLRVAVDEPLHHGGQLAFGPDGYLYVGVGDGIRSFDILQRLPWPAQDLGDLRGKVLRLDIDCATACEGAPYAIPPDNPFVGIEAARPEVFAFGFRNPWKFSFDREGGALYLSDVGNDRWEEINRVVPGGDHGWPRREGFECLAHPEGGLFAPDCDEVASVPPLLVYGHPGLDPAGGNAVTGGYVYRGALQPPLWGRYLYADWVWGRIWSLDLDGGGVELLLDTDLNISSFVEDEAGELYLLEIGGTLYRLNATSTSR